MRSFSYVSLCTLVIVLLGCGESRQSADSYHEMDQRAASPYESTGQLSMSKFQYATAHESYPYPDADSPILSTAGEGYDPVEESGFKAVSRNPFSTFSIDVDTASYSNVRRFLERDQVPPAGAIRIEELINYFNYDDSEPTNDRPFAVNSEAVSCPWNLQHQLVRIGLKGKSVDVKERPSANLVFLIDVSGSMRDGNKLPLVKRSLLRLLEELDERDHVAIVTYAGNSAVTLSPTPCNQRRRISQAIDSLRASGSTNGSSGLQTAYALASQSFQGEGINRILLCSDGDFNVGLTNETLLISFIEEQAKADIFLSVLGFGMGNYQDWRAEKLADHGNGNYAYIDSYDEARKVLVEELTGTLITIAKDVKIQVEFNPANVAAYRLIGYENRALADKNFRNDKKDAGEIGAGHSITALYEVVPTGIEAVETELPEFRYQSKAIPVEHPHQDELFTVRLRYKLPHADEGIEFTKTQLAEVTPFEHASENLKFASSVALFGMILRDSQFANNISWQKVHELAETSIGDDPSGYRTEFLKLVERASQLVQRKDVEVTPAAVSQKSDSNLLPLLAVLGISHAISSLRAG